MESVMKKTAATSLLASCAVSLALFSSCASQEQNTLTPEEIADGWVLLFDGKTLDGWKDYNGTTLTQPWHVLVLFNRVSIVETHVAPSGIVFG